MVLVVSTLWKAPPVNPISQKAQSIPFLNPVNLYGRVFFFSWFGFLIAFWSWYAFPPLLSVTIKKDLNLSQKEILNSNILALTATLLVRLVAGPCCDRFGPRRVFAGCLLIGAIPTALAGTIHDAKGLMIIRFFIGILGGSFVPCQVWTTAFFDKNVVGTANAVTAGLGNAGAGITYFVMPAIFNSLVHDRGMTPAKAWRVAFIVPFILIVITAVLMLILCPDTPTGRWADRHQAAKRNPATRHHHRHLEGDVVGVYSSPADGGIKASSGTQSPTTSDKIEQKAELVNAVVEADDQPRDDGRQMVDYTEAEVIVKPTFREVMAVTFSLPTFVLCAGYFCSFGAELAINSILGSYYLRNFPRLGQTGTGNWAAMFGLLNAFFRPLGGTISDFIYRAKSSSHSSSSSSRLWGKKMWIHLLGVVTGAFMIVVGLINSHDRSVMFGLVAGMALFLDAGNGANFSLVPHVHPFANGIVSGLVGASGNLGGIVFTIIFRYEGLKYERAFWIIGVVTIAVNVLVFRIRPIPRH